MKSLLLALVVAVAFALPGTAEELDRSQPVPSQAAKSFQLPPIQESRLENGVKLALTEVRRLPIASVEILVPGAGVAGESDLNAAIAIMAAGLMKEGAGRYSAKEFRAELDDAAIALKIAPGSEALIVTVFAAKENLERGLELAASALREPRLPQPEFDRLKQQLSANLAMERKSAPDLAGRFLKSEIYGDHPYARQATAPAVESLTLSDVRGFVADRVGPEGLVIAAAGDLDMAELERLATNAFGGWRARAGAAGPAAAGAPVERARGERLPITVVDVPSAKKATIRAGELAVSQTDPDYFPLMVAVEVLAGGGLSSRLNANLRETHGWTYGAGGGVDARRAGGRIVVGADVNYDAVAPALVETLKEMARMGREPVGEKELAEVKKNLSADFVREQETVQAISGQAAAIAFGSLPADYLETYRAKTAAVTADQVLAVSRKYLDPSRLTVVVSGRADLVANPLQAVGEVRVVDAEGRPLAVAPGAGR